VTRPTAEHFELIHSTTGTVRILRLCFTQRRLRYKRSATGGGIPRGLLAAMPANNERGLVIEDSERGWPRVERRRGFARIVVATRLSAAAA